MGGNNTITTDVDSLIELVKKRKSVSFDDVAKQLGLSSKTVESWATFLEEEGIVSIEYKFTTPYITFNSDSKKAASAVQNVTVNFSPQERINNLGSLLNRCNDVLKEGNFQETDQKFSNVISQINSFFENSKLSRGDDKPFENKEIQDKITKINDILYKNRSYVRANDFVPAKGGYDKVLLLMNDVVNKFRSLYFEMKSRNENVQVSEQVVKSDAVKPHSNEAEILLKEAYEQIKNDNFDGAYKIYGHIEKLYGKLPDEYEEKKNLLKRDMIKLNRDLALNMHESYNQKIADTLVRINELVRLVDASLNKNDLDSVKRLLERMNRLFSDLPEGYLRDKSEIRKKITDAHHHYNKKRDMIFSLQKEDIKKNVRLLLGRFREEILRKDIVAGESTYKRLRDLFEDMPLGFLHDAIELEAQLLDAYKELLNLKENDSLAKMKSLTIELDLLFNKAELMIKNNDITGAAGLYKEIKDKFACLPEGYILDKSKMENKILELSEKIVNKENDFFNNELTEKTKSIQESLNIAQKYISNSQIDLANELFLEISKLFNSLPAGFLHEKTELHNQILNVFRSILLTSDSKLLGDWDSSVKNKYDSLLKMIISFHKHLDLMELNLFQPNYEYIVKLYDQLPHGFVSKNNAIRKEIYKLLNVVKLSNFIRQLDNQEPSKELLSNISSLIDILQKEEPQAVKLLEYARKRHNYFITGNKQNSEISASNLPTDNIVNKTIPLKEIHNGQLNEVHLLHPDIEKLNTGNDIFNTLDKISNKKINQINNNRDYNSVVQSRPLSEMQGGINGKEIGANDIINAKDNIDANYKIGASDITNPGIDQKTENQSMTVKDSFSGVVESIDKMNEKISSNIQRPKDKQEKNNHSESKKEILSYIQQKEIGKAILKIDTILADDSASTSLQGIKHHLEKVNHGLNHRSDGRELISTKSFFNAKGNSEGLKNLVIEQIRKKKFAEAENNLEILKKLLPENKRIDGIINRLDRLRLEVVSAN